MFGRNGKISKRQNQKNPDPRAGCEGLVYCCLCRHRRPERIFYLVMDSDGGSDLSLSEDHAGF